MNWIVPAGSVDSVVQVLSERARAVTEWADLSVFTLGSLRMVPPLPLQIFSYAMMIPLKLLVSIASYSKRLLPLVVARHVAVDG